MWYGHPSNKRHFYKKCVYKSGLIAIHQCGQVYLDLTTVYEIVGYFWGYSWDINWI